MPEDGVLHANGLTVVHQPRAQAETPERRRPQFIGRALDVYEQVASRRRELGLRKPAGIACLALVERYVSSALQSAWCRALFGRAFFQAFLAHPVIHIRRVPGDLLGPILAELLLVTRRREVLGPGDRDIVVRTDIVQEEIGIRCKRLVAQRRRYREGAAIDDFACAHRSHVRARPGLARSHRCAERECAAQRPDRAAAILRDPRRGVT